jgi:hypothetical protein
MAANGYQVVSTFQEPGKNKPLRNLLKAPFGGTLLWGSSLKDLASSVGAYGLINDIMVTEDGLIIAGEQRWRAALPAGLETVPVKVVVNTNGNDPSLIVRLRIEENLRRRDLSRMDKARAIAKLYELAGIRPGRTPGEDSDSESFSDGPRSVSDIAEAVEMPRKQVMFYHTLSHLIPPLAEMLDAHKITMELAYKFAQLPPEDQQQVVDS